MALLISNDIISKEQIEIVKKALNVSSHCLNVMKHLSEDGVSVLDACIDINIEEFFECEKNKLTEITGWKYCTRYLFLILTA